MEKTLPRYLCAWMVHALTAGAAVVGLYALYAIYLGQPITAFALMGLAIFIDAIDGTLARRCHVKEILPHIDGALLDNLADFLNYAIVPTFFLITHQHMFIAPFGPWIIAGVVFASAYQFTQADAKTPDHFFKGFPSYWNLMAFYLYALDTSVLFNTIVVPLLILFVFVPIKCIYPSRMENVTNSPFIRWVIIMTTLGYGLTTVALLWLYPATNIVLMYYALIFMACYFLGSFYRTCRPLQRK